MAGVDRGGPRPYWRDSVRGLLGSLAVAALVVVHDGLIDGSRLLACVVYPPWLIVALVS